VASPPERELRALIVVANPTDLTAGPGFQARGRGRLAPIDVDTELELSRTALAAFRPVLLRPGEASLDNIIRKLDEGIDILYLVGHGVQAADVPLLMLEKHDGTGDLVDARRLEEYIRNLQHRPVLIMLNSCQSAGTGDQRHTEDGGALVAIGPRLAAAGVAAVIGMQSNVTMSTAKIFAAAFFTAFARDRVVDGAMTAARGAIRPRPDWWVPVLFSRLRSGRIHQERGFTDQAEKTWNSLTTMIQTKTFTPVLGPGLADGILGSREYVASRWARRWQMPIAAHASGNLAQVAQYLRVSYDPGMVVGELLKYLQTEMHERIQNAQGNDPFHDLPDRVRSGDDLDIEGVILEVGRRQREDPDDPFRAVAAMPVKVFVTTGLTGLLQDSLEARGKTPKTLCFPWTDRVRWEDHYRERRWSNPRSAAVPTVEEPWVYHLFGRLEVPASLVLTEDDHFDWLSEWVAAKDVRQKVPPAVKSALAGSSLLFLGYRLDDWNFRIVFQSIKSFQLAKRYNSHVGVQLRPESQSIEREAAQRYLESHFGEDRVNIFWDDTATFLTELCERTGLTP
jgi:hypothetical protein